MEQAVAETSAGVFVTPLLSRITPPTPSLLLCCSFHSLASVLAPFCIVTPRSSFIFIFPFTRHFKLFFYSWPFLGLFDFLHNILPLCYFSTCLFALLNCFYLLWVDLRFLQSLGLYHLFWFFHTSVFFLLMFLSSSLFSCSITLTSFFSFRLFHTLLRLQRRSDGGWPRQAAGVLRDPLRLISHSAFAWPGEREWEQRRLQQQRRQFGSPGGDAAQRRAGSGQAVCPCGHHSAGHPQHRLREVRHNSDVQSSFS